MPQKNPRSKKEYCLGLLCLYLLVVIYVQLIRIIPIEPLFI